MPEDCGCHPTYPSDCGCHTTYPSGFLQNLFPWTLHPAVSQEIIQSGVLSVPWALLRHPSDPHSGEKYSLVFAWYRVLRAHFSVLGSGQVHTDEYTFLHHDG